MRASYDQTRQEDFCSIWTLNQGIQGSMASGHLSGVLGLMVPSVGKALSHRWMLASENQHKQVSAYDPM